MEPRPTTETDARHKVAPTTMMAAESAVIDPTGAPLEGLEAEPASAAPTIIRALGHSDFRNLWIGNFLSNIGTWMQNVAEGWLVLQLTNSAFWLGMVGFAAAFPVTLFTIFGGVIADRVNKKRLVFVTQTIMMICSFYLAGMTYFKLITVHQIVVVAFIVGTAMAFNAPAYQSLVPRLIPKEDLSNAIALNSAQFNMSRVLGPALGGFAMRAVGIAGNYFLNAISFLAVLIALTRIDFREEENSAAEHGRVLDDLREGLRYVFGNPRMGPMVMLVMIMSLLAFPYISFLPLFARNVLHVGEQGLGMLMAASGIGAFVSAVIIAQQKYVRNRGEIILRAGIGFCTSIIIFALSHYFWLSIAMMFTSGLSMLFMAANVNTSLQHLSSDAMRGRVMSIYATSFLGLVPVGSLIAGLLGRVLHPPTVTAAMSSLALLLFLVVYVTKPEMREPEA